MKKPTQMNYRALNLMIAPEIKELLDRLALRRGCSMAEVVRRALTLALPLLDAVWNAEERRLDEGAAEELQAPVSAGASGEVHGEEEQGDGPSR